jgi:macrolide transport system ATP-binding/permease protein
LHPSHLVGRFFRRQRKDKDTDLALELESHLAHEVDDNLARGMSPEEARRQAYVKLGNPLVIRDRVWEARRVAWLEDLWRDLRYAARTLAKTPSFTSVALLVMALGIGANTSIYSFLDSLLWHSLPVADPGSLVVLNWHARALRPANDDFVMESMSGDAYPDAKLGLVSGIFPYPAFESFEKDDGIFSDLFGYSHTQEVRTLSVSIQGQAETAPGELVTGDYFKGLGVVPAAGRLITSDDDRVGAAAVAVVSHAFSRRHFGSAANAAGQSIMINNLPFTVVGATPPEFFGVDPAQAPDVYLPMHSNLLLGAQIPFGFTPADYLDSNYYWLELMGRLRPGVTLAQAQARLEPRFQQWVATTAKNDRQRANLPRLYLRAGAGGLDTLRRQYSKPLFVLMTLVGLILAIACSNVANLLLARGAARKREIALRMSAGASRYRLVRQLLTESVLLGALGGLLGVGLALGGIRVLAALLAGAPAGTSLHPELNWHVLLLATTLSLLTGVLFGLAPAWRGTDLDLAAALKETQAGQPRARRWFLRVSARETLVVGQMGISLLMLVAAGLFVRTLSNLESVSLGFNRENLLLFQLNARQSGHKDSDISEFYENVRERLAAIPGVRDASLAEGSLIGGENQLPISLPGLPPIRDTRYTTVGADFLSTMQIPLVAGRDIAPEDRPGSQAVAVINEEFARLNFPGRNPLGQHLRLWKDGEEKNLGRDMEIVGIAKNARYGSVKRETLPVVYIPYNQGFPQPDEMMFAVRTAADPLALVNSVREVVHQADARLPLSDVRTEKAEVAESMYQEMMLAELCSAFAVLALTIASVGLYGSISYSVARRTGEIGIRMALGAQRGPVVWMVLREVLVLAGFGLVISLPIALGTSKFVASLLFAMKPNDPLALTLAVATLLGAAVLAGGIPARRASHIDPMTALRHE